MNSGARHRYSSLARAVAGNPIGLGMAAVGRPAYITLGREADLGDRRSRADLEARAHSVLDAAWEGGARYVDAARSYGAAEDFLASWLALRDPAGDFPVIGSKWGYTYTGDWRMAAAVHERKDLSASTFRRQLAETQELLGQHLALYQIHSATIESGVLEETALLSDLAALRATGVAIGVTVTGPRQAETIDRALEVGIFDSIQATWNLIERSAEPALTRAHDAGLFVIVKEAMANGRLAAPAANPVLLAYAGEHGVPPDAVAIAAAVMQPWSNVVLSGAVSPEMFAANRRALELVGAGVDPAGELARLRTQPDVYWHQRSLLPWQ